MVFSDPYVPSKLLSYVRQLLLKENVLSAKFVHSILEHLNWSFSEFIGQLQEVTSLFIFKVFDRSLNRPVSAVVTDIAVGAGGLEFDYLAVRSDCVANGSPPLPYLFRAVMPRRQAS